MKRGLLIALGVVVLLTIVAFIAIGPMVNSRVRAAADKRALHIEHQGVAYRFTHAELSSVTITPKGSRAVVIFAPTVDARLQLATPTWVVIPRADVTVTGSVDEVVKALSPVRKADEVLPPEDRLPIDVQSGALKWKEPLGAETAVSFSSFTAEIRPKESLMHAALKKGKIELPQFSLSGVAIDLRRVTTSGEKLDVRATMDGEEGHAALEAHRHEGNTELDLSLDGLAFGAASPKVTGLDLSNAVADGVAHAERSAEGAIRSNGKLAVTKIRLPPVKVGPVSLSIGGTVKVTWKGSPKKGSPGTMTLDDAKVEVTLGGRVRVIKIRGDISIGDDARGPYLINLSWDAGPFACSEIAGDLAGPIGKGLVAGAVSGNINAHGTIKGDVTEITSLKHTLDLLEACTVDLSKGLGGMLKGLPF